MHSYVWNERPRRNGPRTQRTFVFGCVSRELHHHGHSGGDTLATRAPTELRLTSYSSTSWILIAVDGESRVFKLDDDILTRINSFLTKRGMARSGRRAGRHPRDCSCGRHRNAPQRAGSGPNSASEPPERLLTRGED